MNLWAEDAAETESLRHGQGDAQNGRDSSTVGSVRAGPWRRSWDGLLTVVMVRALV